MSVLCTFPGRHGDLLWALPTMRALSETLGGPVDLLMCGEFSGLGPLLYQQPYLHTILFDSRWGIGMGWQPPQDVLESAPLAYERIFHLGYRHWPTRTLPMETYHTVPAEYHLPLPCIDLTRPWITLGGEDVGWPTNYSPRRIAVGFTECYFELKYGLYQLVDEHTADWCLRTTMGGGRWSDEGGEPAYSWEDAAMIIRTADVFLGDCSALHVLAVSMGIPVVLVEPMEARWNEIFYPCGKSGGQVTLVVGGDAQPTFDARHTCETLTARLAHLPAKGR